MNAPDIGSRYDVVIAGARCAGASTAMLLARRGLRVLVVDPGRRGSDTLSTHALMRGAVIQLHRWGVLEKIRAANTPPIHTTTFYYGDESIEIAIKPRDGVDALYAPRRFLLDSVLVDAAVAAGAHVVHGVSLADLVRDPSGRVRGALVRGPDGRTWEVAAEVVIGADGLRSRTARLVGAEVEQTAHHRTASIYGYAPGLGIEGYHWYYQTGLGVGAIPTNDGNTCVFASLPPDRFREELPRGLEAIFHAVLAEGAPELADRVVRSSMAGKLRAFAGETGFLRRSAGPGWALVGDAGYFRDPLTAHGITDALRDAELLARAVVEGGDVPLADYQAQRDRVARGLLEITDEIASLEWSLDEVKEMHLVFSRRMGMGVDVVRSMDAEPGREGASRSPELVEAGP